MRSAMPWTVVKNLAKITMPLVAGLTLFAFCPAWAEAEGDTAADPVKTYMTFHDQLPGARSLGQLSKYFSQSRWAEMSRDEKTMPAEEFAMMFQFFKKLSPEKVILTGKSVNEDVCILTLKGHSTGESAKSSTRGKVTLKNEGGAWKIEKEEWQCSQEVAAGVDRMEGEKAGGENSK